MNVKQNRLIIIVLLLGLFIFILIQSRIDRFENTTTPNTPPLDANKTCSSSIDISNVCLNYKSCCPEIGANINSKCFCTHPFIINCNTNYNSCLANASNTIECDKELKKCCGGYSNIDIYSSNFNNPINAYQTSNQICTINGLPNLAQRCMEMCQTNPNCKAYSLVVGGCTLYDNINSTPGNKNDNYIYVSKK